MNIKSKTSNSIIFICMVLIFSCEVQDDTDERPMTCFEQWTGVGTNQGRTQTYRGGWVSITDRTTNETCTYDASITFRYQNFGGEIFSVSLDSDVNPFASCSNWGSSVLGFIDSCSPELVEGERGGDSFKEYIFVVQDGESFEGFAQIYDIPDSGVEEIVVDFIFSVPK